jgi:tetratricopeptide (TPR) repeat protein
VVARRRTTLLAVAVLVALVAAVYFPTVNHAFLHWDDELYVFENPHVLTGLSPANVAWAFGGFRSATWQPLTWLSYMTDATLFGTGPRGFHTVNLVLHALASVLLFLALRRFTGAPIPSAARGRGREATNTPTNSAEGDATKRDSSTDLACLLVAALFAVHPLNVEPVAWVAGRKDLLAAVFWFTTLLLYARHAERPSTGRLLAVVASFACGLMSKPVVMTLPVVLLLLDAWPLRRPEPWRRRIVEKLPLVALSCASFAITFLAQREAGAIGSLERSPAGERLANALLSYVLYLRDAVWPLRLAAFYPREPVSIAAAIAAGAFLAAVTLLVFRQRARRPHLPTGWLWFVIVLLPMSGLVQFGSHARADRFTYIPMIGVFLAVAWTLRAYLDRRAARIAAAVVLVLLAAVAHRQARFWRDDETLFGHALRVTRENYLAHMKLGTALAYAGKPDEALAHFREVVGLRPRYLDGWYNYATALNAQGRRAEAIEAYGQGLSLAPRDARLRGGLARAWNNRGVDAAQAGRVDEALRYFEEAVRAEPEDAEARGNLERARAALGRPVSPSSGGR